MAQSIKISDDEMLSLRREADLSSRSIAGQAEHWMRIGRAIESSSEFDYKNIRKALSGLVSPDDLGLEEQEVFVDMLADSMWSETPEQTAFYAERREKGLGVGMDTDGNIIREASE